MIEFFGWACLTFSTEEEQEAVALKKISTIKSLIRTGNSSLKWDISGINGSYYLNVLGGANHLSDEWFRVLKGYQVIAELLPNAYGLLYIRDDEDPVNENTFLIFCLKKGTLSTSIDTNLSPCFPEIE